MLKNPTDPRIESIDGTRYKITESYPVDFALWLYDLQFTIPKGFETDIASVPRLLRWLYDRADMGLVAPVVHDYLCELNGSVLCRKGVVVNINWFDAALLFLVIMRIDGIRWPKALAAFAAVVLGGPRF